mmetsp:Transcript_25570/g.40976  ORF Transcript_25570/g.40976 Transcript_25570/m.40976 type:complete len:253 (+) Transcript_25570:45-803(+)|eukprot:CAMPEP_0169252300 /NCGR_PEP_ID=MMETSP1016-20121227/37978_1 /TAXON_ID=342587 /ORGANISM="Karlodinium micrum, Strain CCMP2283" /LENGTH=252 /DNA_ID=CAMNT_0009333505 /DNA_START=17 /DNA_END=775 /DNA_ORIENTATION=-
MGTSCAANRHYDDTVTPRYSSRHQDEFHSGLCSCDTRPCNAVVQNIDELRFGKPVFGDDAEDVLEDELLTYVKVPLQRMLHRLLQIAHQEESEDVAKFYAAVLQQVLELITAAVCDVTGGHLVIAVVPDTDFNDLELETIDKGLLSEAMGSSDIYDKAFQKRVWFYKSWVQQFDAPVQGGFVIDHKTGSVLAAAVNFLDDFVPMTPVELAVSLKRGVVFARTETNGVRVYPVIEVQRGQAYQVDDGDFLKMV